MPKFHYTITTKDGKSFESTLEARSREAAQQLLEHQGSKVLSLTEASRKTSTGLSLHFGRKKVKLKDLVVFTRQLSTMINAGVPLARSLGTMQQQTENPFLKETLVEVSKDVESGISLADALGKHPKVFSPVYVNMVRAGEAGGILDEILKKLALQQEKDAAIRGKVKSASTYPMVLIGITVAAFFLLTLLVIPKIGTMLKEIGGEDASLPTITAVMLGISDFMKGQWYILIALLVGGIFFFRRWHRTPAGKRAFDKFLLQVPVLKTVIAKVAIARFARIFASLMSAGVSVLEALEVTGNAIGNTVIQDELLHAAEEVRNGRQLSEPLAKSKYFPPIVSQMLAVGEETGQSSEILLKIAEFYEEEVDALVDGLSSIIEPLMIAILGGMVGLIAASVIGPISSLSQNIEGSLFLNPVLTLTRLWL